MTTVSTAIYQDDGMIIPAVKPKRPPREVLVVYVDDAEKEQTANKPVVASGLREALKRSRGILPADFPDGVTFENTLRKEAEDRLRKLDW